MDDVRFDSLARALTDAHSRRCALGGLLAWALGLLGVLSQEVEAHDPVKACKKKSGDAKKKCLKKAKKHNAQHASETSLPPPSSPTSPPASPISPPPSVECVGQPTATPCTGGAGECWHDQCYFEPTCNTWAQSLGGRWCTSHAECCSGSCSSSICAKGGPGAPCLGPARGGSIDCTSGICVGYHCV